MLKGFLGFFYNLSSNFNSFKSSTSNGIQRPKIAFPSPSDSHLKMLYGKAPRNNPLFSSGAAKSIVDYEDLLVDILLRLPIRSLVRFKSVSKRWLSIISDPSFCHLRSTLQPLTPSGIFLSRPWRSFREFDFVHLLPNPPRLPFQSLEFSVPNHEIAILQSCNGLLLCCNQDPKTDYYVYNPTTKEYRKLPKLQTEEGDIDENSTIAGLSLAFDPLRSSNYKVVCVRILDSIDYQIKIYSSDSDSGLWKLCSGRLPRPDNTMFDCGIYWKEAVHWIGNWANCVYLDLSDEELHELPLPRAFDHSEGRRVEYFGNCGGHLHYIEGSGQEAMLNVYEMKEDRGGWFEKYRVDLQTVLSDFLVFPEMSPEIEELNLSKFTVLAIVDRSEVDEDPYIVLHRNGKAARLNMNSGSYESLAYIHNGGGSTSSPVGFGLINAFLFFETLACV